ncbi:MAG: FAD-binding oxidoreductase, partial [Thermoleophilaceae bacterium]
MTQQLAPESFEQAAAWLAEAAAEGRSVRPRGSGTKLGWGAVTEPAATEISTARLDAVLEHNAGDLTAVLQAGVPLAQAQARFATAGQMLALDPPLGEGVAGADSAGATVGGVLATADSGPLRHRYGAARDLVIGMTVALSDGTLSSSGGKVIKNVAGYDLGKLFAGSFGTLGLILSVAVRLHP